MPQLSRRIANLAGSPVRAMLKAAQQPGMISFAGGLPAPDSFADIALPPPPAEILQYGPTEGEPALRERISEELALTGLHCPADRIMVLSGSQQGVDLAAKLCVDEGTVIGVESPAYLAALQVFRLFGASFQPVTPGGNWAVGQAPAMAYVTPTFQNPTGRCWSLAERQGLAAACDAQDVVLFEDDPYRDLVFGPCERTPVASFVTSSEWIYQSSFSKTVAPGLRLGYLAASEGVFQKLAFLKQAADLHSNRLSQWIVLNYLNDPNRAERMRALVDRYIRRRNLFAAAMQAHLGGLADWEMPNGGLFFWLTLRDGLEAAALLDRCVARGVLFTPGSFFEAFGHGVSSTLRLNFSHADEASAERGLAIMAEEIRRMAG